MNKSKRPKIYSMNDCDTVIAYSKKEAVCWYSYKYHAGDKYEDIRNECIRETDLSKGYWFNLPPKQVLDKIMSLKHGEELKVSMWAGDPAYWVTFKYAIENLLDRIDIPGIICTTEY